MGTLKRINREIELHKEDPPEGISWSSRFGDPFLAKAWIAGPPASPYAGGQFELNVEFPTDYPFNPPEVKFVTPIYHPNITTDGLILINILIDEWCNALTLDKVLLSIQSILDSPLVDESSDWEPSMNPEMRHVYCKNRDKFEEIARDWTERFALSKPALEVD